MLSSSWAALRYQGKEFGLATYASELSFTLSMYSSTWPTDSSLFGHACCYPLAGSIHV